MYSIWLQSSKHNKEIYDLIKRFAKEEGKDSFFPHVTLVTKISTYEKAIKTLKLLSNEKCNINFDKNLNNASTSLLFTIPISQTPSQSVFLNSDV